MKTLGFRPLRRNKKTGKVAVASYSLWRPLTVSNYRPFVLEILSDFKDMSQDEMVYNHEGEPLFFPPHDPWQMPIFSEDSHYSLLRHYEENPVFCWRRKGTVFSPGDTFSYHGRCIDIDGVPAFTNYTINDVATHYKDMNEFEPLTVGVVMNWFGWLLDRLHNAQIRVVK